MSFPRRRGSRLRIRAGLDPPPPFRDPEGPRDRCAKRDSRGDIKSTSFPRKRESRDHRLGPRRRGGDDSKRDVDYPAKSERSAGPTYPGTLKNSPTTYPTNALAVPMSAISRPLRPGRPTVRRALWAPTAKRGLAAPTSEAT